ncbi:MAG: hypothetical protein AAGK00_20230 [Pseudomonadota bacterium]
MFLADIKLGLRCRISVDPHFIISGDLRRYVAHIDDRFHVNILEAAALEEAERGTAEQVAEAEALVDVNFPDATSSQRRAFVMAYHMDFTIRTDRYGIKTMLADAVDAAGKIPAEMHERVRYIFQSEALFFKLLNSSRQFFALSCRMHPDVYHAFFTGIIEHETRPIQDIRLIEQPGDAHLLGVHLQVRPDSGLVLDHAQTRTRIARALRCHPNAIHGIQVTDTTVTFEFQRALWGKRSGLDWISNRLQDHLLSLLEALKNPVF